MLKTESGVPHDRLSVSFPRRWPLEISGKIVVKPRDSRFHSRLLVDERFKTKIQFNGREYAAADEMPVRVRVAYERFLHETPVLHSGARLAAKLKAKIIVNDTEFNHAGETSVDDRHLYHEALEAVFPSSIAMFSADAPNITEKKGLLVALLVRLRRSFSSLAAPLLRPKR
jgi:hypothetical protein